MKTQITLHATLTDPSRVLTFRDIDRKDRSNGMARIGYHYVIERDGTVKNGRLFSEASIHDDLSVSRKSIGICLVGGANAEGQPEDNFTDEQRDELRRLVNDICRELKMGLQVKPVSPCFPHNFAW